MGYLEVAEEANRYTGKLGTVMFFISGGGVSLNYYIPSLIPFTLISGMYWVLSMNVLGMIWIFIQHLKNPHHAVGEKCPKCRKAVLYTGVRCSNTDCDYKLKF